LKHLKEAVARHEICDDRVAIASHRLQPTSFAYPFGGFDAGTKAVVAACGYNSGRGVSGVNDRKVFAETVPPLDAYATRTPPDPKSSTTLATMEGYVTAAEQNGSSVCQALGSKADSSWEVLLCQVKAGQKAALTTRSWDAAVPSSPAARRGTRGRLWRAVR
jgi:hypothetical protein